MKQRITFFSDDDMAFGYEYKKIEARLPELLSKSQSLEDMLELVEIDRYLRSPRLKVKDEKSIRDVNIAINN